LEENKTNNVAGQSEPCIIGKKETPDDHKEGAKETPCEIFVRPQVEIKIEEVEQSKHADGKEPTLNQQIDKKINQIETTSIQGEKKHRIKLSTGHCLTVPGRICDVAVEFLIDTGAAVSVINMNMWERLRAYKQFQRIGLAPSTGMQTVNGEPLKVQGKINLPIDLSEVVLPFDFHIVNGLTYDAILGKDFLEYYRSRIDLSDGTLE
jgi:hypothetical protein